MFALATSRDIPLAEVFRHSRALLLVSSLTAGGAANGQQT